MKDNGATKEHLIVCAQEAWDRLEEKLLNKLAEGMQKRLGAVKAANWWYAEHLFVMWLIRV